MSQPVPNVQLTAWREANYATRGEMAEALCRTPTAIGEGLICDDERIRRWERGEVLWPHPPYRKALQELTGRSAAELGFFPPAKQKERQRLLADRAIPVNSLRAEADLIDDEVAALELSRRVAVSEIGPATLAALETAADDLAIAYPATSPADLLGRVRAYLSYVARLVDARKTLTEHRRLLVAGGWLSLLAATCHIDLHQHAAAAARLRTAAELAKQAEHPEIVAWCLETHAWQCLTDGDYRGALTLSQGAQRVAPRGGSAFIQATAQEGRAWARLGAGPESLEVLGRLDRLVSPLPMPDRPEHHYRYDPGKSDAYHATTLSWLGDPAAEPYARHVLARLEREEDAPPRPRRVETARLDLALALITADRPDEAAQCALAAVTSGRLVPSNYWRAAEVITALTKLRVPEAGELEEAYRNACGTPEQPRQAGAS
jgi:hypothetical protein